MILWIKGPLISLFIESYLCDRKTQQRLRLYFFIPTIELTTKKRINLYYDRVDRPLCEAFQHAINLHYGLTAPDDPQKLQTHKVGTIYQKEQKRSYGL